jgi:hypothetical protein
LDSCDILELCSTSSIPQTESRVYCEHHSITKHGLPSHTSNSVLYNCFPSLLVLTLII